MKVIVNDAKVSVKYFQYAFDISLTSMPRSCIWYVPLGFPYHHFVPHFLMHVIYSPQFHPLSFNIVNRIKCNVQIMKFFIVLFSPSFCSDSSVFFPHIILYPFFLSFFKWKKKWSCLALFYSEWFVFGRSVLWGHYDGSFMWFPSPYHACQDKMLRNMTAIASSLSPSLICIFHFQSLLTEEVIKITFEHKSFPLLLHIYKKQVILTWISMWKRLMLIPGWYLKFIYRIHQ
jgi:hypothetical protein